MGSLEKAKQAVLDAPWESLSARLRDFFDVLERCPEVRARLDELQDQLQGDGQLGTAIVSLFSPSACRTPSELMTTSGENACFQLGVCLEVSREEETPWPLVYLPPPNREAAACFFKQGLFEPLYRFLTAPRLEQRQKGGMEKPVVTINIIGNNGNVQMGRDLYSAGQAGAMGPGAQAQEMLFQQEAGKGRSSAEAADMHEVMRRIRDLLSRLGAPEQKKIDNALAEAMGDLERAEPDHGEIREGLNRALRYATHAASFAAVVERLRPLLVEAASWGGAEWHDLLGWLKKI